MFYYGIYVGNLHKEGVLVYNKYNIYALGADLEGVLRVL